MNITDIKFQEIRHYSREYFQAVYLRYKLLRQPLKMHFTPEQLSEESSQIHLAGIYNDKIIACLTFIPFDNGRYRMRQVAVQSNLQSQGIGKELVKYSEIYLQNKKADEIFLHARESAVQFYRKLGYIKYGELFYEVNLPHYKMKKSL